MRRPLLTLAILLASCGTAPAVTVLPSSSSPLSTPPPPPPPPSVAETPIPATTQQVELVFASKDATPVTAGRQISFRSMGDLYGATIRALLAGPTEAEQAKGAVQMFDPSVKLDGVDVKDSGIRCIQAPCPTQIVHLRFTGKLCSTPGAAFNEGALIGRTMQQFREVAGTKIWLDGKTQNPDGAETSIPECLEP